MHLSASATWEQRSALSAISDRVGFAWSSSRVSSSLRLVPRPIREGTFGVRYAFKRQLTSSRFGDGIYSYRNPALADRFATSCTSSPYRVIIACDVSVEPEQCSMDEVSPDMRNEGIVANHTQVGEEESLFVPSADAIIPAYIIMYAK